MWRRFFLVVLWVAGTAGATGVVFYAVSQMSTDLANVNESNADRALPRPRSTSSVAPPRDEPSTSPAPAPTTLITVDAPSTAVVATTVGVPEPPESTPTTDPPPPPTGRPTTATTRPSGPASTVSTQAPPPLTTPPTAPPTTPATTEPPPPPPPTTPPPATVSTGTCNPYVVQVKRIGTVSVRACSNGIHFVTASVVSGAWSPVVLAYGPPSVSVQFNSTAGQTYTCSLSGDTNALDKAGDC